MTGVDLDQVANRREQILFALVALVLIVLFFRVFYAQQSRKINEADKKLQALSMEKNALIKFAASTPSLQKSETLSRKKGIKMKILFGEVKDVYQEVTTLLAQLTEPGFLGRIKVQKMSFEPDVSEKGYRKTDFSLNILGSYLDVVQYLERLEQFPALFRLESVNLQSAEGHPQELMAEVRGRFFRLDPTASSVTLTQASPAGGKKK